MAKAAEEAERKAAALASEKEKRQADAKAKAEEEARLKKAAEAKAEEARKKAATGSGSTQIDQRQAKQIDEEEARKKTAASAKLFSENYSTSQEPNLPDEKKVEVTEKDNRTITKIAIRKNGLMTIYRKVEHQWGAVYYFRGMESITQIVFDLGIQDL